MVATPLGAKELQLSFDYSIKGDNLVLFGKTNLPEGTKVSATLTDGDGLVLVEESLAVKNGLFRTRNIDELGRYTASEG
ncbi:hypothetical protein ACQZV8_21695, partial [Magnetococcales bacterium HHB-1]